MLDNEEVPSDEDQGDDPVRPRIILNDDVAISEDGVGVRRIPTKCKISYCKISLFKKTGDVRQVSNRTFQVLIPVGRMANNMQPFNSVFYTGAGPSFIEEKSLEAEWLRAVQLNNRSSSVNPTYQKDQLRWENNITHQKRSLHSKSNSQRCT